MFICIDAGHGGTDPGTSGNGLKEKEINLDISLREKKLFEDFGHKVILTRKDDINVSLKERADLANNNKVDIFISNHINAGGGKGVEVYHSIIGGQGEKVALAVVNEIASLGLENRGAKSRKGVNGDYLYVIRETTMPAILVEHAFIDWENDANLLKQNYFRSLLAKAVVIGTLKAYNLPYPNIEKENKLSEEEINNFIEYINKYIKEYFKG